MESIRHAFDREHLHPMPAASAPDARRLSSGIGVHDQWNTRKASPVWLRPIRKKHLERPTGRIALATQMFHAPQPAQTLDRLRQRIEFYV
jgi:hypothetical protein